METVWFMIVAFMLVAYVVLDGFDIGAGIVHYIIGRNSEELFRKVQAAQFIAKNPNEVCPAKWTPGAATLKPGLDLVGKI